jgi:hypothetical protein
MTPSLKGFQKAILRQTLRFASVAQGNQREAKHPGPVFTHRRIEIGGRVPALRLLRKPPGGRCPFHLLVETDFFRAGFT